MQKYCNIKYGLKNYQEYSFLGKLFYKLKYRFIYSANTKIVYKFLIRCNYDIEIGFVEGFSTKLVANSLNKKSKKYAWVHTDMDINNYADSYYETLEEHKRCYKHYNKVICVSKQALNQYERKFNLHNSIVIYNPIDTEGLKYYKKDFILEDKIKLCVIGRLEYQKGFDRLIHTLDDLKKFDFELSIIGTGSEEYKLKELVKNYGLENKICFTGFLTNPYEIMANSNLIICSSRSEGYSLVVAEGICLGIPILTTNCTGPSELIDNGKFGIIVENSLSGLKNGLLTVFDNPFILKKFHVLSTQRASIFGINQAIKEIEAIFDE